MNCDGCLVGPNQFALKRNNDVSSDIGERDEERCYRGNLGCTQKIKAQAHSQQGLKGHVRSNKHEAKPDSTDATMLLNSFPPCVMSLKCKCYYFAYILSLSRPFQEITATLWQEVTGRDVVM